MAKVEVVILNWNTRGFLESYVPGILDSLKAYAKGAELVVADSGSTDGSMDMLREKFPQVRRIELDDNYGFTGGYNRSLHILGKEVSDAEYYILLNSDIEVTPDWITPLADWLDANSSCAACAPKLLSWQKHQSGEEVFEYAGAAGGYIDALGYPFCRGRVLKRVAADLGQYDSPAPVMWASGACLCIRRSVWEEMEGLDDRYFAHMEEIDLCWRCRLAGYDISVVPESKVYHIGGGTLQSESPFKLRLNYRNSLLTLRKNLFPTFRAMGNGSAVAHIRSGLRFSLRYCLDYASAAVYLLQGHKDYANAVFAAHREYREMRGGSAHRIAPSGQNNIKGFYRGFILLENAIFGKKIFEHLIKHEDRY